MSQQKYHIPQLQPLSPCTLFSKKKGIDKHFPFSHKNNQYYYLARNALWYGIDSLGLKPGDIVLMPAYHHGIEVETLLRRGLKLKYYRIDRQMKIDFDHLNSLVTPDTKALYVIHYIGFPHPLKPLSDFAARHNLKYIEDCALSLFSSSNNTPLGTSGDISIFCLYKTLPVPHGGMLVINNESSPPPPPPKQPDWVSTFALLSNRLLDSLDTNFGRFGYRLNNLIKATARIFKRRIPGEQVPVDTELLVEEHIPLGVSPITNYLIDRLDRDFIITRRRNNYTYLAKLLNNKVDIPFPDLEEGVCPLFLPILVEKKLETHRKLIEKGVEAVNFWSRTHPDVPADEFPEVNYLRQHILELPIHQGLQKEHLEYIASVVEEII